MELNVTLSVKEYDELQDKIKRLEDALLEVAKNPDEYYIVHVPFNGIFGSRQDLYIRKGNDTLIDYKDKFLPGSIKDHEQHEAKSKRWWLVNKFIP